MNPPSFLSASLQVALGGALGAWLRYGAGLAVNRSLGAGGPTVFPWATFGINVLGSFAMGLLAGWLVRHGSGGESWRLLIGVGLLGGFTTFSAFSLELVLMIQRGALANAAGYAMLSVLAGVVALFAGLALLRVPA